MTSMFLFCVHTCCYFSFSFFCLDDLLSTIKVFEKCVYLYKKKPDFLGYCVLLRQKRAKQRFGENRAG